MSLFETLTQIGSADTLNQIAIFYGDCLSMHTRSNLACFLEESLLNKSWPIESNQKFRLEAEQFINVFVLEIQRKAQEMTSNLAMPIRSQLLQDVQKLQTYQTTDPCSIYTHLIEGLKLENGLVYDSKVYRLMRMIGQIESQKCLWIKEISEFREYCRSYGNMDTSVEIKRVDLETDFVKLCHQLKDVLDENENLLVKLFNDYIKVWKWEHRSQDNFLVNGANLDTIQSWMENLIDGLVKVRKQIREILENRNIDQDSNQVLYGLQMSSTNSLTKFISKSLVFEKQPSQIIETLTKIKESPELRLLVANVLDIKLSSPPVSTLIISQAQAQQLTEAGEFSGYNFDQVISKHECNLLYDTDTVQMTAKMPRIKLDNFSRGNEARSGNVTDEKFAFLVQTKVQVDDLTIKVWELSMPIVITVHPKQETKAWATIFWDNFFAKRDRKLFEVDDSVSWSRLSQALNQIFFKLNGRGLTEDNLHCLAEKIFRGPVPYPVPDDYPEVTWHTFCKQNLLNHKFSFSDWFCSALRLTTENFSDMWQRGNVIGFISKEKTEQLLSSCPTGTFILRFSDSMLGHISFSLVDFSRYPSFQHIFPLSSRNLALIPLASYIQDIESMTYLYPNIPKQEAFNITVEQPTSTTNGSRSQYVPLKRRFR